MVSVSQNISVENVGEDAVVVVGKFPVGGLFCLRVMDGLEADPVVPRIGADPAGFLLTPVGEWVGLGVIALVDKEEHWPSGWQQVHIMPLMRYPPAIRRSDREASGIVKLVITDWDRGRAAGATARCGLRWRGLDGSRC